MSEERDKDRKPEAPRDGEPGIVVNPLSRRRFTKAGLAAPVLMSLASRPVWGRECTASAMASFAMNQSVPIDLSTCRGCSPGYWHHINACWDGTAYTRTQTVQQAFYPTIVVTMDFPAEADVRDVLTTPLDDLFPAGSGNHLATPAGQRFFKVIRAAAAAALSASHPLVPTAVSVAEIEQILGTNTVDPLDDMVVLNPVTGVLGSMSVLGQAETIFLSVYDEPDTNCPLPNNGNCP